VNQKRSESSIFVPEMVVDASWRAGVNFLLEQMETKPYLVSKTEKAMFIRSVSQEKYEIYISAFMRIWTSTYWK
jgi:hypothetical protein